jgi:integrase
MERESSGYVGKDDKNRWFARITFRTDDGKRKNIVRRAVDKREAKLILKKLVRELEGTGNHFTEVNKITFRDLSDFYEAKYAIPAKYVNERKVEGLRDTKHIKAFLRYYREFFGEKRLKDITYADLCSFKNKRLNCPTKRGKARSVTTVNRELAALRRMFSIAVQQDWLQKNPFKCGESLIQVSAERKRERVLTAEEEIRLLAACESTRRKHLRAFLVALLATGCRKSEMLLLRWRDVELDRRLITIRALNTKTLRERKVAITPRLLIELLVLWEKGDKHPDSFVFGARGNVRKSFSSACREAGIKEGGIDGLTLHSLRHTVACRLIKGNLPIQMVGRLLGHTNPQTTYRYLSANDETLYEAASILDSVQRR